MQKPDNKDDKLDAMIAVAVIFSITFAVLYWLASMPS